MIVLSILGGVGSLVVVMLIHSNYDDFSLRVYKLLWAFHLTNFCLHFVLLMFLNELFLLIEGGCATSSALLSDPAMMADTFSLNSAQNGVHLVADCLRTD